MKKQQLFVVGMFTEKPKPLIRFRDWGLEKITKAYKLIPRHSLFQEDWKYCIILDACRYDIFKKVNDINGRLEKIYSPASHTVPFCQKTFTKESYDDIVCLSANPHVDRQVGKKFHKCIPIWKDEKYSKDGTTLPQAFIKPTRNATIQYPNKRLLLWFVQPHAPYIGYKRQALGMLYGMQTREFFKQYKLFFWAHLSRKQLRRRYAENLIRVLEVVKQLLPLFNGKTVITSDHGEGLADYIPFTPIKIYGHYRDIHTLKTIEVPYLVI